MAALKKNDESMNLNEEEDLPEEASEAEESEAEEDEASEAEEEDVDLDASEADPDVDPDASEAEDDDVDPDASEAEASEADPDEDPDASDADPDASEADENKTKKTTKKRGKKVVVNTIGSVNMLKTSKKVPAINYDDDEDDDEEEEDDADEVNYLQKFDNKMRDNFILEHHPEARTHNYEEVKALTRVSRDGRGIIIDPLHKTIPFLTKYEMTRVIGQRAKQLDSGAKAFVKVPLNVLDGYLIALLELEQKKLPFIIKRPFPNGGVEYWNVSDLELLL
jgi:DNA-directed RNA polymerase subunit K/omega